jgi:hypothetical protein
VSGFFDWKKLLNCDEKYTGHQKCHIYYYRNIFVYLYLVAQLPLLKGQQDKTEKYPAAINK